MSNDDVEFPYGRSGEKLVSTWLATDWLQYLALRPRMGRTQATYESRFWLNLTDQRLLVLTPDMVGLVYELPLNAVLAIDVTAPPNREGRLWDIARKLYQVETVKIVHGAEPTTKAMFYDLATKTRPFAKELQDRVRAAGGRS